MVVLRRFFSFDVEASKPTHNKYDNVCRVSKDLHLDLVIILEIEKSDKVLALERVVSTPDQERHVDCAIEDSSETLEVDLDLSIISDSAQNIFIALEVENVKKFVYAVYAHSNYLHKRNLWAELSSLRYSNPSPWCYIGDFNVFLGANECRWSHLPLRISCEEFQNFTNDEALTHILTRGAEFTWSNRRRGYAHTKKRFDRTVCVKKILLLTLARF
ncbi:hypothetical protein Lal_00021823 [Lupinus albus]|nr:hypothetical protein Lal_00021823 [Lupinus albus]